MIRTLLGIVLGLVAAGLAIFGVESLGHWLHPIPADIDWQDRVAVTALVESLPTQALLIVLAAWAPAPWSAASSPARSAPCTSAARRSPSASWCW